MQIFTVHTMSPPGDTAKLREEVRALVARHQAEWDQVTRANCWATFDPQFSRTLAKAGFIGMTWPKKYGGRPDASPDAKDRHRLRSDLQSHRRTNAP